MTRDVLVVGAAGGVGLATALALAKTGRRVIATVLDGREEATLREALPEVAAVHRLDLSDAEAAKARLDAALDGGELAAAVICAGISPYGPLEIMPLALARRTFEVNALSNLAIYQAVMPLLRQSKGRFVMTSSTNGRVPVPFIGHYSASKHALEAYADVMRQEAAQFGVAVIVVEPGTMDTPMTAGIRDGIGAAAARLSADERALYGHYYERFDELVKHGAGGGIPPSLVADTIVAALDAERPESRYPVGEEAANMIALRHKSSDREMDALFHGIFFSGASYG